MQQLDLRTHLDPQLRIEIRQRFIEQEHHRITSQRTTHRHTLPLTTRELTRFPIQQMRNLQRVSHTIHNLLLLLLGHLPDIQPKRDIFTHRHRRIQRVRLEHHRDIAIFRRQVVHRLAVDLDLALRHGLEAGDHVEQRRLTAARAADENQELAVFDVDVDTLQNRHPIRVSLVHVTDGKACHAVIPLSLYCFLCAPPVSLAQRLVRAARAAHHARGSIRKFDQPFTAPAVSPRTK